MDGGGSGGGGVCSGGRRDGASRQYVAPEPDAAVTAACRVKTRYWLEFVEVLGFRVYQVSVFPSPGAGWVLLHHV